MNVRDDYILRMVAFLVEILRKMVSRGEVDVKELDQILEDVLGINLEGISSNNFLKQMVKIGTDHDENKKALAVTCLYLKDKEKFGELCFDLLSEINLKILDSALLDLIKSVFEKKEKFLEQAKIKLYS